jgi:S-(hydroxymethyl)glutathione dehydrogenase/alcohol dehydrogenase
MIGSVPTRAAVAHSRRAPLRIEEIEVAAPRAGEVAVRIAACGICASDLHVWRSGEGIAFPAVLGHEASGVVEAMGPDVRDLAVGSRVLITWVPRCGTCRACRAGRSHVCAAIRTSVDDGSLSLGGQPLARYMGVGGLAERVVVPARSLIRVPDALPLRDACLVGCGVTTGYGAAVITGGVRSGESVAVFGCGGVGLSAVQGARIVGASRIIAVDPNASRLALAARLGATHRVSPADGDPVAAVRAQSEGGVDLAVEAVGRAEVARQAFDALAPGGRAIVVGLAALAEEIRIPMVSLLLDKMLRGSIHGSADPGRDVPQILDLAASGALDLDSLAGPDHPLEKVNDAMEALANGRAVRPRVVFGEDSS